MQIAAIRSAGQVTTYHSDQVNTRKQLRWLMITAATVLLLAVALLIAKLGYPGAGGSGQNPAAQRHPLQLRLVMDSASADTEPMADVSQAGGGQMLYVQRKPLLDGIAVEWARVRTDPDTHHPYIRLALTDDAVTKLNTVAQANYGRRVAIVIDGKIYSAPIMKDKNFHTIAEITGNFSQQEAEDLARRISQ